MSEAEPGAGPLRILIVDAYSGSREGLSASLRTGGSLVEPAAGSGEAIRKLGAGPFDVALIDLDLPAAQGVALTGWDLVRILRALIPAAAVFVMSADGGREVRARAEALGVARVLEKPISPAEVRAIVRSLGEGLGPG